MDVFDKVAAGTINCLNDYPVTSVVEISNLIARCQGCVYMLGVGKSGNMAKHCSDLLKSISIRSFFLECNGLLHGDIGTISSSDIVIIYSKSGNTHEVLDVVPHIRYRTLNIIGVFCETETMLASYCNRVVCLPFSREVDGDISTIPTTSCVSQLFFSNMLVSLLKDRVNIAEYRSNHPAGSIGEKLTNVADVLVTDVPRSLFVDRIPLRDVLLLMTEKCMGCCFFVDEDDHLVGIMTDGDIRRLLTKDIERHYIDSTEVNTKFEYETDVRKMIEDIDFKHSVLPVIVDGRLVGAIVNGVSRVS